jgi:hypothetical protein
MESPATASGNAAGAFFTEPLVSSAPEIFAYIRSEFGRRRLVIEPTIRVFSPNRA